MRESTFTNAICKAESKQISKDFAYCEDALGRAENAIGNLPSAQPEKRTEERTETHACDLIDRQAAIEIVDRYNKSHMILKGKPMLGAASIVIELEALPSAQPEQRWIPCSERLPEDYEDVLVWFEYFRYGDYNRLYQTHGIGDYSSEYDSWMINHESGWSKLRVFAWMPLPEPYRGEI